MTSRFGINANQSDLSKLIENSAFIILSTELNNVLLPLSRANCQKKTLKIVSELLQRRVLTERFEHPKRHSKRHFFYSEHFENYSE